MKHRTIDPIVNAVLTKFVRRSHQGMQHFRMTMAENNKPLAEWLIDLQEEMMDSVLYIQKILETGTCEECGEILEDCFCGDCPECKKPMLDCSCVEV